MADENESNNSGGSVGKAIGTVGIALLSLFRCSDDILRSCGRVISHVDEVGTLGRTASSGLDDAGRMASSGLDDAGRKAESSNEQGKIFSQTDNVDEESKSTGVFDGLDNDYQKKYYEDFYKRNKKFNNAYKGSSDFKFRGLNNNTIKEFKRYESDISKIEKAFGEESALAQDYHNSFVKNFSSFEARQSLLPDELINQPTTSNAFELYSLFKGLHVNEEQALLLRRLTYKPILVTPDKYNDYILIEQNGDKIIGKSTSSKVECLENNMSESIDFTLYKRVVIKGNVSNKTMQLFSDNGIKYVRESSSLIRDIDINKSQLRFIYIASKDEKKMKDLFQLSESQAKDMAKLVEDIDTYNYTEVIEDHADLIKYMKNVKRNERPVYIFNNINNKLFGNKIETYKIKDFITCNSYETKIPISNTTTDFIYFEDFSYSIDKAQQSSATNAEEFWYDFTIEYNKRLARRQLQVSVTVTIGITTAGGGGFAIYYNAKK
ncbi:hypothetical protein [Spirosoma sp. KNUC1025]|uniref:hypothetical protein n=1 Tax=Spirosoma sp. KNUC1025 TaxID=2894082 RepID=UPI00386AF2F4|nr:hypothetical protein LN737_04565 [Spirosoma sp. KNUC1025]